MIKLRIGLISGALVILAASSGFAKSPASSKSRAPTQRSVFKVCSEGSEGLRLELAKVESATKAWAKNAGETKLGSAELTSSSEGRLVKLFAAHLLPKSRPFSSFATQCWTRYIDFRGALADKDKAWATESLGDWQECLKANESRMPAEAEELVSCWRQISASQTK